MIDLLPPPPKIAPLTATSLDFVLPPDLEAHEPAEVRGTGRDDVRLMVSYVASDQIRHAHFRDLPRFLHSGDVLVINTSGTRNAAIAATRRDGTLLHLHLSTRLPADLWSVELREPTENGTQPFSDLAAGERLRLPHGGTATILAPSVRNGKDGGSKRLWIATLDVPGPLDAYLDRYGFPIRYSYVPQPWPIEYYQTVYATDRGSAEMPSAGRAFTPEILTRLIAQGVQIAPLVLHTGVASVEAHEGPYDEWYWVPAPTAQLVTTARADGRRVIAVGTTVVRALETVTDRAGKSHPGEGWTSEVITPERGVRAVDGLLTGFHEPRASHLLMLEAIAGREHVEQSYAAAVEERYLWHEFGDLHLILPYDLIDHDR